MSEPNNYIPDKNPLNLKAPPKDWLQKLWDFDDSLVVIPSRMQYVYRLCQRRPPDRKVNLVHRIQNDSDSQMLASYGLVPVTTIVGHCRWDNPLMFEDLRQRMPSRMGGWQKYEQLLLDQEKKKELDERQKRDDMLDVIAKDSLGFYKVKAGLKTQMYSPKTKVVHRDGAIQKNAPAIKIAGKYDKLEQHLKKPFSVKD